MQCTNQNRRPACRRQRRENLAEDFNVRGFAAVVWLECTLVTDERPGCGLGLKLAEITSTRISVPPWPAMSSASAVHLHGHLLQRRLAVEKRPPDTRDKCRPAPSTRP